MPRDPDLEPGGGLKDSKSKFELKKTHKGKGEAEWNLDKHAMAYVIRGLNCLIGKYERMIEKGETLDNDDVKSFEFIKELRNGFIEGRDRALPDGAQGPPGSDDNPEPDKDPDPVEGEGPKKEPKPEPQPGPGEGHGHGTRPKTEGD